MRSAVGAVAMSASKATATPMGKTEAAIALLATFGFANTADQLPPAQAVFAWSVAGTIVGALLGGLHLRNGGWLQRLMRGLMCAGGGLLLAPFAIAQIPRASSTPEWWHAFAASGIAAFVAWIVVEEAGPLVRDEFDAWRERRRERRRGARGQRQDGRALLRFIALLLALALLAFALWLGWFFWLMGKAGH